MQEQCPLILPLPVGVRQGSPASDACNSICLHGTFLGSLITSSFLNLSTTLTLLALTIVNETVCLNSAVAIASIQVRGTTAFHAHAESEQNNRKAKWTNEELCLLPFQPFPLSLSIHQRQSLHNFHSVQIESKQTMTDGLYSKSVPLVGSESVPEERQAVLLLHDPLMSRMGHLFRRQSISSGKYI